MAPGNAAKIKALQNTQEHDLILEGRLPDFGGLDMFLAMAWAFASAALYQSFSSVDAPDVDCACGGTAFCCAAVTNGSMSVAFFSATATFGFGWLTSTGSVKWIGNHLWR